MYRAIALVALAKAVVAQNIGTLTPETHPKMPYQICDESGCTTEQGEIVLDSNWRWLHTTEGSDNCYDGNKWVEDVCPDGATCAKSCALEGAEYEKTYGISTPEDGALKLQFVTKHEYGTNVGSRVYLMESEDKYKVFNMLNKEITFDVDVSKLPCGLNGAVYFSEMEADGGMSASPANKAGAKYGTGYCDSQCPQDIKFINGEANVDGWGGSDSDPNSGFGKYGTCCAEMDLWEANLDATAYTPHPCDVPGPGQTRCEGTKCGSGDDRYAGICDKDGCDFNSMRMGAPDFYGPGMTVNTEKPITVVTQFLTADGTDAGELSQIKRFYVQGGKVIPNSNVALEGVDPVNHISADFCSQQKTLFDDTNHFETVGGLSRMGESLKNMVLVLSVWDDHAVSMNWLDSHFPTDADPTAPGVTRGRCDPTAGEPAKVEKEHPDAFVVYSNIKYGSINSTFTT